MIYTLNNLNTTQKAHCCCGGLPLLRRISGHLSFSKAALNHCLVCLYLSKIEENFPLNLSTVPSNTTSPRAAYKLLLLENS